MKKTLLIILALTMVFTIVFTGCKKDTDETASGEQEKTLVVGLDDGFPPMGYRDDNGNLIGFDIDLAKEVCKRLGYEIKLQVIDWTLKQQELESKNIDCIWNGYTINDKRLADNAMTEPYMKNRQILVVKADSTIATLDDMAGKKLALQAGSSAQDALDASPDFKESLGGVLTFDKNTEALMDLKSGGSDAVLIDEVVALHYVTDNEDCKALDLSLADEEYGIGFRKSDTELRDKVQNTLKEMAADGKLAEISKKWFDKDVTIIK